MAQTRMARITCDRCNAWYNSERELNIHMEVAHRLGRGPAGSLPGDQESSDQADAAKQDYARIHDDPDAE